MGKNVGSLNFFQNISRISIVRKLEYRDYLKMFYHSSCLLPIAFKKSRSDVER